MAFTMKLRDILFWVFCLLILGIAMWCASGTLAPYAITHTTPTVIKPCKYLVNLDHGIFESSYLFLDGAGRDYWHFNPILRRILYPLLSYPLMKQFGFIEGGFFTNLLITVLTVLVFCSYVRSAYGKAAANVSILLLSTYPGITYWAGLPYSYAAIVPCSLLCFIFLDMARREDSTRQYFYSAIAIGLLALAYDLLPFFGASLLFLTILRLRLITFLCCLPLLVLPTAATITILYYGFDVPLSTSNSDSYGTIVNSYLNPPSFAVWWPVIKDAPWILLQNYFHSNFYVLPFSFLIAIVLGYFILKVRLTVTEMLVLLFVLGVFLFNNLAPPYQGVWQLRGTWIARLYQPVFVVFILYLARVIAGSIKSGKLVWISFSLMGLVFVANAAIVFGPISGYGPAGTVYHRFYQHVADDSALEANLAKFGRRPLGFCKRKRRKRSS